MLYDVEMCGTELPDRHTYNSEGLLIGRTDGGSVKSGPCVGYSHGPCGDQLWRKLQYDPGWLHLR